MSTPPTDDPPPAAPPRPSVPEPTPAAPPVQDSGSKGDLIALGIGCGVFLILLVAIVLVGMSGR